MWARRIEREIDLGQKPAPKHKDGIKTFANLIDLHIADMVEVGKRISRSQEFSVDLLRKRLGKLSIVDLNREQIIKFGMEHAGDGAGATRSNARHEVLPDPQTNVHLQLASETQQGPPTLSHTPEKPGYSELFQKDLRHDQ